MQIFVNKLFVSLKLLKNFLTIDFYRKFYRMFISQKGKLILPLFRSHLIQLLITCCLRHGSMAPIQDHKTFLILKCDIENKISVNFHVFFLQTFSIRKLFFSLAYICISKHTITCRRDETNLYANLLLF